MSLINATEKDIKRFNSKIDVLPNGCHYWQGARSKGGGNKKTYGTFHVPGHRGGQSVRAHRFASEVFNGDECPPGFHRDHTCGFSMCVNPAHIEVVSREENQRRKTKGHGCRHEWVEYRNPSGWLMYYICVKCAPRKAIEPGQVR